MSDLTECYATETTPFGALGPFYDELGHRGADYDRDAGDPIIAYDDMVVEYVGHSAGLGTVLGCRRLTLGGWAGFAHTLAPVQLGATVKLGGRLADVAGAGDDPGTLWDGPHIHTTESHESAVAAALGVRPLTDPAPAIAAAIGSAPAGLNSTPVDNREEETSMSIPVPLHQVNKSDSNQAYLAVTDGMVQHISRDYAIRLVAMRGESWEDLPVIDEHGRNVLNVTLGNARKARNDDTARIVSAAVAALGGGTVSPELLAAAVNVELLDEFAGIPAAVVDELRARL